MEYADDDNLTKKMQNKLFEMMVQLREILDRNGIKYFLSYGTALGCVRHQDFIPWDDDVDIYIFGSDYPKLQKVFSEQDTGNLVLHDFTTVKNYPYTFPKIVAKDTVLVEKSFEHLSYKGGVYIDIFPLAAVKNSPAFLIPHEIKHFFNYCVICANTFQYKKDKSALRRFAASIFNLFSLEKAQKSLYKQYIYNKKNKEEMKLMTMDRFGDEALLDADWFEESVMRKFKNEQFSLMGKYDEYLTHCYGNYMQLPPESQRVSNHNFAYINLDTKEVIK